MSNNSNTLFTEKLNPPLTRNELIDFSKNLGKKKSDRSENYATDNGSAHFLSQNRLASELATASPVGITPPVSSNNSIQSLGFIQSNQSLPLRPCYSPTKGDDYVTNISPAFSRRHPFISITDLSLPQSSHAEHEQVQYKHFYLQRKNKSRASIQNPDIYPYCFSHSTKFTKQVGFNISYEKQQLKESYRSPVSCPNTTNRDDPVQMVSEKLINQYPSPSSISLAKIIEQKPSLSTYQHIADKQVQHLTSHFNIKPKLTTVDKWDDDYFSYLNFSNRIQQHFKYSGIYYTPEQACTLIQQSIPISHRRAIVNRAIYSRSLHEIITHKPAELLNYLQENFSHAYKVYQREAIRKIKDLRQSQFDSLFDYNARHEELCAIADLDTHSACKYYLKGLSRRLLPQCDNLANMKIKTYNELVSAVTGVYNNMEGSSFVKTPTRIDFYSSRTNKPSSNRSGTSYSQSKINNFSRPARNYCYKSAHEIVNYYSVDRENKSSNSSTTLTTPSKSTPGNKSLKPNTELASKNTTTNLSRPSSTLLPTLHDSVSSTRPSLFDIDKTELPASIFKGDLIYLNISFNINAKSIITRAHYDSGAQINTISPVLVDSLNLTTYPLDPPQTFSLADGQISKIVSTHYVRTSFYISGILTFAVFFIGAFEELLVLGIPWVRSYNPIFDFDNGGIKSIDPPPEIKNYLRLIQKPQLKSTALSME